jgi:hypothetical protein
VETMTGPGDHSDKGILKPHAHVSDVICLFLRACFLVVDQ